MAELNGKYVNEENHQKVKTKLQKIGRILLGVGAALTVIGIVLLIVGFVFMGKAMNEPFKSPSLDPDNPSIPSVSQGFSASFGFFVGGGIVLMIGFGMLIYGVYAAFFAHAREIASYSASTVAPVFGETANYLADETSPAIQKVASAISNGIRGKQSDEKTETPKEEQKEEPVKEEVKYCIKCGAKNTIEAKFCTKCGNKF